VGSVLPLLQVKQSSLRPSRSLRRKKMWKKEHRLLKKRVSAKPLRNGLSRSRVFLTDRRDKSPADCFMIERETSKVQGRNHGIVRMMSGDKKEVVPSQNIRKQPMRRVGREDEKGPITESWIPLSENISQKLDRRGGRKEREVVTGTKSLDVILDEIGTETSLVERNLTMIQKDEKVRGEEIFMMMQGSRIIGKIRIKLVEEGLRDILQEANLRNVIPDQGGKKDGPENVQMFLKVQSKWTP